MPCSCSPGRDRIRGALERAPIRRSLRGQRLPKNNLAVHRDDGEDQRKPLYVDSQNGRAEAVGKHRVDVPHAQDGVRDVRSSKGVEREKFTEAPVLDKDRVPGLAGLRPTA